MAQDVSLAPPPYDFVRLCHFSRLVQLGCLALQVLFPEILLPKTGFQMFLVYSEFSSLSYFQLIFYETLCAASFYLVFSRWQVFLIDAERTRLFRHSAVDGRFDLEQLVNARDLQRRVPYIVGQSNDFSTNSFSAQ